MELKKFDVSLRTGTGKNVNNRLRAGGLCPGIVYGKKKQEIMVKFDPNNLVKFLDPAKKRNTYFEISVDGAESEKVIIRDASIDSLSGEILHVDFLRMEPTDRIDVTIPFILKGRSEGQKLGGKLRQIIRELPINCEVSKIPELIDYDISPLKIDTVTRIEDLPLPEGLQIELNPRQAVLMISGLKAEKTETEGEEEI
ncbi:MAG: 50S ribosomal protein L25 [Deltaproteobacteria bacterium]|nr:50S ribosomal protein L25 [Deltaproteobacteria bacterium]